LELHGYRSAGHAAHQITAAEIEDADLVLGMEDYHLSRMRKLAPGADNLRLLTDFAPPPLTGEAIEDPYYGSDSGFEVTRIQIEACMPRLMEWIREQA
jgi:protein-tyrosine phosphatase